MFERETHAPGAVLRARGLRERMNYPEQRLWRELRKLDAHIRRQAPIGKYVVDFACPSKRVVVEIEGAVHQVFADAALRDIERTAWLESQGFHVLRFTDRQVLDELWEVVDRIKLALALPLDGVGMGGGAGEAPPGEAALGSEPRAKRLPNSASAPPSPTLPPLRGKGE